MRHASTLKRLAAITAVGGAALAFGPAAANAASSCTFNPNAFPVSTVDVNDDGGLSVLRVTRSNQFIAIDDGHGLKVCSGPSGAATVLNTDRIFVHGAPSNAEGFFGGFMIDESNGRLGPGKTLESDGRDEIEVIVRSDNGVSPAMHIIGTELGDMIRVSANGGVMLGSDNDNDIRLLNATATEFDVQGRGGDDYLSGRGGYPSTDPAASTSIVDLNGGLGNDTLVDGPLGEDSLAGAEGNDTLYSVDGRKNDHNFGGAGFDTVTMDALDTVATSESVTAAAVGKLRMDRTAVSTHSGRRARVTLGWKHPKAWKQLRSLELTVNDAGKQVGSIRMTVSNGRISSDGAVHALEGSKLGHHGRWVTARLKLRAAKSLAGKTLRLSVAATDVDGKRQVEPQAGSLKVN